MASPLPLHSRRIVGSLAYLPPQFSLSSIHPWTFTSTSESFLGLVTFPSSGKGLRMRFFPFKRFSKKMPRLPSKPSGGPEKLRASQVFLPFPEENQHHLLGSLSQLPAFLGFPLRSFTPKHDQSPLQSFCLPCCFGQTNRRVVRLLHAASKVSSHA
jgi:hypothetical protein